jgi:hypothetical protein
VLREAAEYPNSFIELRPGQERIVTERYTLCMERAVMANTVQRQRFGADELDDVLAEARSQLRARGRTTTQWEVGSQAQPPDLVSMLLERGLVRDQDPRAVALVLSKAPAPVGDGLIARRVRTFDEYAAAREVQFAAFDAAPDRIAEERAALATEWDTGPRLMHAVWVGDEIVCAGTSAPTPYGLALFGGATLPQARGRGAYRALVRARWDEAVALGQAALLTQGGSMSRPILERIGFEPIGYIEMLIDEFGDRP